MKNIFLLMVVCTFQLNGFAQTNFIQISPTDDSLTIIRKAASVVPSKRQLEWQQWEKTGFIHFGINTFTGEEWGSGKEDPSIFKPIDLDTEQWVRIAKQAGIQLLILTAKHHDGFCLWPTKTTEHSVKNSPFKRDIVQELSAACKKYGIKFGFYLSPWDRNSVDYGTEQYNSFFRDQLLELLTQYGKIDEVWLDGANGEGPNGKKQEYDFKSYFELIRKHQPEAVIAISGPDVRWVGTETGYGRETEWSVVPIPNSKLIDIPADPFQSKNWLPPGDMMQEDIGSRNKLMNAETLVWYPAETDVSIRPGWFYHEKEDDQVKSPEKLLDIYYHSIGKNGVLLLNIPPNKRGRIHENDSASLVKWNEMVTEIFRTNLVSPKTKTNIKKGERLWDQQFKTAVSLGKKFPAEIEFQLPNEIETNLLLLQEDISRGQKIEKFSLWVKEFGVWKKISEGSTVGYKRILPFQRVLDKEFKLVVESARAEVFLSEFGLYYDAYSKK